MNSSLVQGKALSRLIWGWLALRARSASEGFNQRSNMVNICYLDEPLAAGQKVKWSRDSETSCKQTRLQ